MKHLLRTNGTTWASLIALLALVVLTGACGGGGGGGGSDVAAGHEAFKKTCAVCHGPNAEGMPKLGKDLHNNEFVKSQSDDALLQFIIEGRPATHPDNTQGVDMPPRGGNPALTDDDIRLIIGYMRSIS
jgi:disulfide bond formation protein DsbB